LFHRRGRIEERGDRWPPSSIFAALRGQTDLKNEARQTSDLFFSSYAELTPSAKETSCPGYLTEKEERAGQNNSKRQAKN